MRTRCKNIIRPKYLAENTPEKKLVELDEDELYKVINSHGFMYATALAKDICQTFGIPDRRVPTVEDITEDILWDLLNNAKNGKRQALQMIGEMARRISDHKTEEKK